MATKVLFVDDDAAIRKLIQRILTPAFDLDMADSARDALHLLRTNGPYALIISDLHMPGLNGVRLLSRVREIWPNTVRVILTGDADHPAIDEAVRRDGILHIIEKPFDPEELLDVVNKAVREHEWLIALPEQGE